jgi:hypothetical protein
LKSLKSDFLQSIPVDAMRSVAGALQPLNPRKGAVDHASEFSAEFGRAVFQQALLRFFSRKPGGISI